MNKKYLGLFLLMCFTWAEAQNVPVKKHEHSDEEDSINYMKEAILSEITVTGLTGTQRMKDSPSPFLVVSPKSLQQSFGTNLIDAISHQPGLSQISTGSSISKPIIRGLGYNRVVTVEQGIRHESQQWGDEHGLEVDAEEVNSVEVLKGPASLMYGSDAMAGVMILHSRLPLERGLVQVRAGSEYQTNNGLYSYHLGVAGNVNDLLWNLHFNNRAAHDYKNALDGYVPGTWYREHDLQGMLGLNRDWGHSWLRFSYVDFTPGISEGERDEETGELEWEDGNEAKKYGNQMPFQRVLHTKVVSDNVFHLGAGTLKAIIGYQQNYRREFEESASEAELAMRLHTVNYDLKYLLDLPQNWKLATGIGGMFQKNINKAEECLIPDYNLFDAGFFLTANKQTGDWHFSGGARIDHRTLNTDALMEEGEIHFHELKKNFTGVTGSLGAVWNVTENLNLRANLARGFRAPTTSELSSNGVHEGSIQYELGNNDLNPEYSLQLDLGMDYTTPLIGIQASLFSNRIDNYIFLGRLPYETEGYRTYQYRQGDAQLMGGEIAIDLHPVNNLHFSNSFSYVRGWQLHQPDESRDLPMMPAPRWNMDIRYTFPDFAQGHFRSTFFSMGMEYNLRQDHFYAMDDTETATPDYGIFNISAGTDLHIWGHNCIKLTLSCQNLFDKVYQSHLSRLKYADINAVTGRQGISAMGRNFCIKVIIPIDIHL